MTILFAISLSIPAPVLQAEAVDFSCMSYKVKGKIQVTTDRKEYDVILENLCPGTVYWSMCIERMDPWTTEIQEVLTLSGALQMEKDSRVNLQMKNRQDESRSRQALEKFYLNIGYALQPPANVQCVASGCESKKHKLRTKLSTNEAAWQKAKKALAARISTECPQSGWPNSEQDACEAKVRKSSQAPMDQFAQEEKNLMNKLSEVDPQRCQVHAGE